MAGSGLRFFYLALPPITYPEVCEYLKRFCVALNGWTRIVVEKPFGRDLRSSEALNEQICCLFECAPNHSDWVPAIIGNTFAASLRTAHLSAAKRTSTSYARIRLRQRMALERRTAAKLSCVHMIHIVLN